MDVDLSTDLNALLPLVAPLLSGHSDMAIGRLGTVECARTNRRRASAVIGSRSSTGLVSGGMSCTASFCGPTATRTPPKSSSTARRSHMR